MRTENTERPTRMVNLANADRSRIRWERYRDLIIWTIEWQDYNGEWYGHYGFVIDGEWVSDNDKRWVYHIIDAWFDEQE